MIVYMVLGYNVKMKVSKIILGKIEFFVIASCTSDNLFLVNSEGKIGTITSFGTFSVDGFLEVCINQTPRPFCDNDFTYHDAAVACKSMGYSPYGMNFYPKSTMNIQVLQTAL